MHTQLVVELVAVTPFRLHVAPRTNSARPAPSRIESGRAPLLCCHRSRGCHPRGRATAQCDGGGAASTQSGSKCRSDGGGNLRAPSNVARGRSRHCRCRAGAACASVDRARRDSRNPALSQLQKPGPSQETLLFQGNARHSDAFFCLRYLVGAEPGVSSPALPLGFSHRIRCLQRPVDQGLVCRPAPEKEPASVAPAFTTRNSASVHGVSFTFRTVRIPDEDPDRKVARLTEKGYAGRRYDNSLACCQPARRIEHDHNRAAVARIDNDFQTRLIAGSACNQRRSQHPDSGGSGGPVASGWNNHLMSGLCVAGATPPCGSPD